MAKLKIRTHYIAKSERGSELAFVVDRLIGEGGQGAVYQGRLAPGGKPVSRVVAIKELITESQDLRTRFINEAGLRLEAPPGCSNAYEHIAEPLFFGTCSLSPEERADVFLLEFIDGQNLKQILADKERLPEQRVLQIIAQIASGLDVAHSNNIIHRDIKPENILVCNNTERVKLTDFGIACFQSKERLTRVGLTIGTAHYMSPEQVQDASGVDCRSDVFSLGVVFYEMLTGHKPFDSNMLSDLYLKIINDEPAPVHEYARDVSDSTVRLIELMLKKDAAHRPQDMRQVLAALPSSIPAWRLRVSSMSGVPCVQCGEVNAVDAKFCRRCGRDLSMKCGSCKNMLLVTDRFCRKCGTKVTRVSKKAVLVGLKGGFAGKRIALGNDVIRLGRHKDNDLSFAGHDKYVSRFQARVYRVREQHWIEGWNWINNSITTNGTYVNGVNIDGRGRVLLRAGDKVRIGDSFFRYEC